MRSCFVATHPSAYYDGGLASRDEIVCLAQACAPVDRYILHDGGYANEEACMAYLQGTDGNFVFSKWGEIDNSFALNGYDRVIISGHLFDVCHLDTYKSILASQMDDMTITVPLYASSARRAGIPASTLVSQVRNPSLGYLHQLHKLTELKMGHNQRSVIAFAARYIDSAMTLSTDTDIDFRVDGQTVLRSLRRGSKKVVVDFQIAV